MSEKRYIVPEAWLKQLLQLAQKAEAECIEKGRPALVDRDFTVATLIGYAKSVESILKFNKFDE